MSKKIILNEEAIDKLRSVAENIWYYRSFLDESTLSKSISYTMEKDFHYIMDLIKEKP